MTIFLLAGNFGEFQKFMEEKQLTRGVFYVSGLKRLEGRTVGPRDKIVFYGTFYMRKDAVDIISAIERCKERYNKRD